MLIGLLNKLRNNYQKNNISLEENVQVTYESMNSDWNVHLKNLKNFKVLNKDYEFDTNQYLPRDWSLQMFDSSYKSCDADFENKVVTIKPIESIENIFSLLHEIGHLKSYYQSSQHIYRDHERIHKQIYFNPDKTLRLEGIQEYMQEEYVAWNFVFSTIEQFKLSPEINRRLLEKAKKALLTHIDKFNTTNDSLYEFRDVLIDDLRTWVKKYV